ncbi:PI-PLC domain-containing protein [Embleya sp. AB8]|uniref:PI-PLC domain-containing protein n=1 Tax=Embleya sp. AB8 TaxID=3156304 RepID=UPI003C776415
MTGAVPTRPIVVGKVSRRVRVGDAWRRWRRVWRALLTVLVMVAVTVLTGLGVARATVLSGDWYDGVFEREHAYDRLYDEVLVDPRLAGVTNDLLGRLPIPPNQVTANLRLVLPPSTLRGMVRVQVGHTVGYLRGDERELRLGVDLKPVINNLGKVADGYVGDLTGEVPRVTEDNAPALVDGVAKALDALAQGRPPESLPALKLDPAAAPEVADLILARLPAEAREPIRGQVVASLRADDLGGVLVAVVPVIFGEKVRQAQQRLTGLSHGGTWDLTLDLRASQANHTTKMRLGQLEQLRAMTVFGLGRLLAGASVTALLGLVLLWRTGPARGAARLRQPALALAGGGLLAGVGCLVAWGLLPHVVAEHREGWAPSVVRLTGDLQEAAARDIVGVWLAAAAVPLVCGGVTFVALALWDRHQHRRAAPVRHTTRRLLTCGAALVAAGALALTVFVPVPTAGSGARAKRCNGMTELCGRRYDQVAFLATHNSMSSTAARFLSPLQDADIVAQLDAGVRGLLVDSYTWEAPEEVAGRLAESDLDPESRRIIAGVVNDVAPAKPGLWLCHSVCRGGALPMVDTLRAVGRWLDRNPREVVTFIVQDAITAQQTEWAFHEAGLDRLLYTPAADPGEPWPTLGTMIEHNRRLVVFAERADGPAPWYRNFYRYGMETPYAYASPAEMNCAPNRGGSDKRLFLLNNFVTATGGSRIDAGRVNSRPFLLDRARRCERERGAPVNFVAVDFAGIGDAKGAVDVLNITRKTH